MANFPASPLPAVTELLINGSWTDFSSRVRDTDTDPGVAITRGRSNESQRVAASTLGLTLDNRDGALSNRLPTATYYQKLGRNTQLRHRLRWVYDTWSRNVSNGFGVDESPMANVWTTSGGSASDFSVTTAGNQVAQIAFASANARKQAQAGPALMNCRVTGQVKPGVVATGAPIDMGFTLRRDAVADTAYEVLVRFDLAGAMRLRVNEVVAGSALNIADVALSGTYSNTSFIWIVADIDGRRIRARAWNTSVADPVAWQLDVTDASPIMTPGQMGGPVARVQTGNTNVPVTLQWNQVDASDFRFWGEVPQWPLTWETSGADVTAPIEAAGIMRRLGSSTRPLRSALNRAMAGISAGDFVPIAYWPMEDGSDAKQFASAVSGQPAAVVSGDFSPASYSGFPGSDPLPVLRDGQVRMDLPAYTDTGIWQAQFSIMIPSSGFSANTALFIADMLPGHATTQIVVSFIQATGSLRIAAFNSSGTALDQFDISGWQRDTPYLAAITDKTDGTHSTVLTLYNTSGSVVANGGVIPDGIGAGTPGQPYRFTGYAISSLASGWSLGHVALYVADVLSSPSIGPNARAAGGYAGELFADRMTRLCREENISFDLIGSASGTAAMGPQRSGKLLDLLFECADADQGILYEPRDAFGLTYRTHATLYNQTGLSLDYSASQVFAPFQPVEDDQAIVNDSTARRANGSAARVTVDSGPLSTQDPPNGIGTYDEDRTYNVAADDQLPPLAGWRAHVGSWDEARYPQVHVNLAAPAFTSSAALTAQAAAVDLGDYLSISNPPAWLPPDRIELLAQGYRETHRNFGWDITWNCTPAGPFGVGAYGDTAKRYSTRGNIVASFIASSDTAMYVRWAADGIRWVTGNTGPVFPFDLEIEGERVRATAIGYAEEDFFSRTVSGGLGTSPNGNAYTLIGTAADFSVTTVGFGHATIAPSATGVDRVGYITLPDSGGRRVVEAELQLNALPASGDLRIGVVPRLVDGSNYLIVSLAVDSTGAISVRVDKRVAGTLSSVTSVSTGLTLSTGTDYTLLTQVDGSSVKALVYQTSAGLNTGWMLSTSDSSITSGSNVGVYARDNSASATHQFGFDTFRVKNPQLFTITRSVNGVAKSHGAGAAVNLWTPARYAL